MKTLLKTLSFTFIFCFLPFALFALFAVKDGKKSVDSLNSGDLSGLTFRNIGPAYCSGRISDFAVNPKDHKEYYVAVASGHVWKTTNAGNTYTPVFDKYGSYSIGPVVMDPNNHNVIWIGTGEYNSQRSVGYGDGVYKSENGGGSFKNMGLKNSEHIGKILIDPRNSDVVYVAAQGPLWGPGGDRGIYKTTDGGKNWKAILTVSENTGFNDIVCDPRNPDVLYATAYQRRRHVFTLVDGGPESAIYKSTDGGITWNKQNSGLPDGEMGRIGLAISPVDPDIIYAIVEARGDKGGFFRSVNRGVTWERRSAYSVTSAQYYNRIFCDPKDVDKVYSMDTYSQVTEDGGRTWKSIGNNHRHVDDHAFWINPEDTKNFMIGGDGGVYETWDAGANWQFKPNLPVTQFYRVAVDNELPFYNVYGGTQDNASMIGPSRNLSSYGIVNDDWTVTHGGDGFKTVVDPINSNIIYAQSQYGVLVRYDRKSGEELPIQPMPPSGEAYRWNWDSPVLISPHKNTCLYFAANKLFKSEDRGNSWTVISPDLTRQIDRNTLPVMGKIQSIDAVAKNASTSFFGNIVALSESPVTEGLIYVGTDDGLVQVTEDGGITWRKIEHFPGVPDMTYVSCLHASQHDAGTVYATFDNHKNSDFKPYVLKSTDKGKSWKEIAANLPTRGSANTIVEDPVTPNLLFVGTEFSLYTSLNGGKRWIQLNGGLPTIAIKDIAIQKRENDLVVATFGRGYYILDDNSPLRNLTEEALNKEVHLFPVKDALMFLQKDGKYGQGETYFAAKNPPVGATFTYYFKESLKTKKQIRQDREKEIEKKGEKLEMPSWDQLRAEDNEEAPYLLFTITDKDNQIVRKLRANASEGISRLTWDFRYPSAWPVNGGGNGPDNNRSGSYAMPGTYKVKVSKVVDGVTTDMKEEISFNTVILNNSSLPAEDRRILVQFQEKVSELGRVINGASRATGYMLDVVKAMREALHYAPNAGNDLAESARLLQNRLTQLSVKLDGDPTLGRRNENQPPSVTERINDITWSIWGTTSSPTQTMKDGYEIAKRELQPLLQELKTIQENDLKKLESQLNQVGAPWTPGRLPDMK